MADMKTLPCPQGTGERLRERTRPAEAQRDLIADQALMLVVSILTPGPMVEDRLMRLM